MSLFCLSAQKVALTAYQKTPTCYAEAGCMTWLAASTKQTAQNWPGQDAPKACYKQNPQGTRDA